MDKRLELTCILCPKGCKLRIDKDNEKINVQGNSCKKGEKFAISEITNPMRTISTTVKTTFTDIPVIPVKLSGDVPKKYIFDIMKLINKVQIKDKKLSGDVVLKNVLNLGVDVIVTSNILENIYE